MRHASSSAALVALELDAQVARLPKGFETLLVALDGGVLYLVADDNSPGSARGSNSAVTILLLWPGKATKLTNGSRWAEES